MRPFCGKGPFKSQFVVTKSTLCHSKKRAGFTTSRPLIEELGMSFFLWMLCGLVVLNLVIVAALHFKPLRPRRHWRSLRYGGSLAVARHRRRPF